MEHLVPKFKNPFKPSKKSKKKSRGGNGGNPRTQDFGSNADRNNALTGADTMVGGILGTVQPKTIDKVKDKHVKSKKKLSGGSAHKVTQLQTRKEIGGSGSKTGYFKADPKREKSEVGRRFGIGQKKGDSHMAARSVTSSRLDKALGIGVLSDERFGKINGKKGAVSAQAQGKEATKGKWSEVSKTDYKEAYEPMGPDWSKKEKDKYYKFDGFSFGEGIDLKNAETQKGVSDLAVMDYLTGQVDRHARNMFIDPETGKVTGIDNDMAFGTEDYDEINSKNSLSEMPDLIDAGTAESLLDMDIDEFVDVLKGQKGDYGHLSEKEIDEAKKRFTSLQAKVQILKLTGGLVDEWNDDTYERSASKVDQLTDVKQGNDYMTRLISAKRSATETH